MSSRSRVLRSSQGHLHIRMQDSLAIKGNSKQKPLSWGTATYHKASDSTSGHKVPGVPSGQWVCNVCLIVQLELASSMWGKVGNVLSEVSNSGLDRLSYHVHCPPLTKPKREAAQLSGKLSWTLGTCCPQLASPTLWASSAPAQPALDRWLFAEMETWAPVDDDCSVYKWRRPGEPPLCPVGSARQRRKWLSDREQQGGRGRTAPPADALRETDTGHVPRWEGGEGDHSGETDRLLPNSRGNRKWQLLPSEAWDSLPNQR